MKFVLISEISGLMGFACGFKVIDEKTSLHNFYVILLKITTDK